MSDKTSNKPNFNGNFNWDGPTDLHRNHRSGAADRIAGAIPIAMLLGNGLGIPGTFTLMAIVMAIWAARSCWAS